jgi:hypothetical protein
LESFAFCPYCNDSVQWENHDRHVPLYEMGAHSPIGFCMQRERRAICVVDAVLWLKKCELSRQMDIRPELLRCVCGAQFYVVSSRFNGKEIELNLMEIQDEANEPEYWLTEAGEGLV